MEKNSNLITLSSVASYTNKNADSRFERVIAHASIMERIVDKHTDILKYQSEEHAKLASTVNTGIEGLVASVKTVSENLNSVIMLVTAHDASILNLEARLVNLERRAQAEDRITTSPSDVTRDSSRPRSKKLEMEYLKTRFEMTDDDRFICPFCGHDYAPHYILTHASDFDCKKTRK